jgi:hypothetical protein
MRGIVGAMVILAHADVSAAVAVSGACGGRGCGTAAQQRHDGVEVVFDAGLLAV